MYFHAHGPGVLHSKKPVHTLEDLRGMKIRSYGFNAAMSKALGGVPVAMTQADVYEALQKGVADATFGPSEVLEGVEAGGGDQSHDPVHSDRFTRPVFMLS